MTLYQLLVPWWSVVITLEQRLAVVRLVEQEIYSACYTQYYLNQTYGVYATCEVSYSTSV